MFRFLIVFFVILLSQLEAQNIPFGARQAYDEGVAAFRNKDYDTCKELFKEAASKGHPEAYYFLGRLVEQGWGYPKDPKRAYVLYKKGLDKGSKRSKRRIQQIAATFELRKRGLVEEQRILPEWEIQEEALHLVDALDGIENPQLDKLQNPPSIFSLIDERGMGRNLPDPELIKSSFIEALQSHSEMLTPEDWFQLCDLKLMRSQQIARFKEGAKVCGEVASNYWRARSMINSDATSEEKASFLKLVLKADIELGSQAELLARYSIFVKFAQAQELISTAFDKLESKRFGASVIEALVQALGHHGRPLETLEIMDFGKDLYAAAYFRSALSFLKIGQIGRAQIMYAKAGGTIGYHESRTLAMEYCWKLFQLGYHKRALGQLNQILIHAESFLPQDWMQLAYLMQDDHLYRKDAQIAFEKGMRWIPDESTLGNAIIMGRAYQVKFLELWGIKGPLKELETLE